MFSFATFVVPLGKAKLSARGGGARSVVAIIYSAMGETETAYHYASRHLDIAKETGDRTGQVSVDQSQHRVVTTDQ